MASIPVDQTLNLSLNTIDTEPQFPRGYMGLSGIGDPCVRSLQYHHYWAFKSHHNNRIERLFNDGHRAEDVIISALQDTGIETINAQAEIVGTAGHWMGHIDGEGYYVTSKNDIFLQEFKTHNDKNFNLVKKNGIKESFPKHYWQMQAYMDYRGHAAGLYSAYNKNDSEIWTQWVLQDKSHQQESRRKELEVITADSLLPRIGNGSPAWFECKYCSARDVCFKRAPIEKSCRSCEHVDILPDGVWACGINDEPLSLDEQELACNLYRISGLFE